MSKSRGEMRRRIFALSLLLMTGLLFANCRPDPPGDNGKNAGTTNNAGANNRQADQGADAKTASSRLRRYLNNVWARTADSASASIVDDDDWHEVREGTTVSTDDNGEGWLRLRDCMTVYVFQKSRMITAPCSKSEYTSGNINCQLAGTSVYNNSCESRIKQIIETPSAEITLEGTWVSVTYLPAHQLTVTIVFQGQASIRPVTSLEERRLGEPVLVKEMQFWLSAPDDQRAAISDLPNAEESRRPQGFDRLQPLLDKSGMNQWQDRIWKRAAEDKINPPQLIAPEETRRAEEAAKLIDCDCQHVEASITGRPSRDQCLKVEYALRQQYVRTGKVDGTCDPRASGPKARPAVRRAPDRQPDNPRSGPASNVTGTNSRRTRQTRPTGNLNRILNTRSVIRGSV